MSFFKEFSRRFPYTGNYVCLDTETSGLSPAREQICTIGHTLVKDHEPVSYEWYALKWTQHPGIDQGAFQAALERTEAAMTSRGKAFHHTWEWLEENGEDPLLVLRRYLKLVEDCEQDGTRIVTQNGWRFDGEFLKASWHNWLKVSYEFATDAIYDTGIAEKACQLPDKDHPLPFAHETMRDWALRVGGFRRKGVFWALDSHCENKYGLLKQADFAAEQLHQSVYDAALLHYLYQEHRRQAA